MGAGDAPSAVFRSLADRNWDESGDGEPPGPPQPGYVPSHDEADPDVLQREPGQEAQIRHAAADFRENAEGARVKKMRRQRAISGAILFAFPP